MNDNTFSAGVVPGGLKDKQEIKILICFILDKIEHSLKKNDITSIFQIYGLANYFEVSQAFEEMVSNKNIAFDEDSDSCYITSTGKMIVDELETSLPVSVREKALESAKIYFDRLKSEKENTVIIRKNQFGYNVCCKVSGGEFDMMEIKLYAPNMHTAVTIRDNFYRNPGAVYNNVISILGKD